jgi:preprotein translocase subunit SecE
VDLKIWRDRSSPGVVQPSLGFWSLILDMDKVKMALAVALLVGGVSGYYYFSDLAQVLRILMVLGGLVGAGVVARFTAQGRELFAFSQEAWQEAGKVSWPTRKETIQTTLVVFAFVVVMALVLFAIDSTLAWLVKLATGRGE